MERCARRSSGISCVSALLPLNPVGPSDFRTIWKLYCSRSLPGSRPNPHQCGVPIPSRTWQQRAYASALIAARLGVSAYVDLLVWQEIPPFHQGELTNNDQRRENVRNRLSLSGPLSIKEGVILLLDDYTGSGATLKEAVRVIRKAGRFTGELVPLTMARVRWRLGASGMI